MAVFLASQKTSNCVTAGAVPCVYEGPLFHRQALLTVELPTLPPSSLQAISQPHKLREQEKAQNDTPHLHATLAGTEDHWQLPEMEKLMTQIFRHCRAVFSFHE